jgi:hypothetical protein
VEFKTRQRAGWSTRAFRALLALYPGEFRDEYGRELAMVFADRYHDASGFWQRAGVWIVALAGILKEAPEEHGYLMLQDLRYALKARAAVRPRASARRCVKASSCPGAGQPCE